MKRLRIGVVGAGITGLWASRVLQEQGHAVVVFDKGRRPGGRLATRRAGSLSFDHGAQYFTVKSESFRRQVQSWLADGVVAEWTGRIGSLAAGRISTSEGGTQRYVGRPGMSALARHLAEGLEIHSRIRVAAATEIGDAWRLTAEEGTVLGEFDVTLVTVPAPQAEPLLAGHPGLASAAGRARLRPCWAVLAAFEQTLDVPLDGVFVEHPILSWAARDSSKPGRPAGENWVLHASAEWSEAHLEDDPRAVTSELLSGFADALDRKLPPPTYTDAHRWRYALPDPPLQEPCLFDERTRLGAGGDWCGGPRIEGAFRSGAALADRVLASGPGRR
jgi:predicted NAD/FAD-dependent oxidoreductase